MNRRDFLKVSSLFSAAVFIQVDPLLSQYKLFSSKSINVDGALLRGMHNGEIHISHDAGRTWQLHTKLGSEYAVIDLYSDWSQRVHAQVAYKGRSFDLMLSKDKKLWRTV